MKISFAAILFFLFLSLSSVALKAQLMGGIGGSYGDDIDQFAPNIRLHYYPLIRFVLALNMLDIVCDSKLI